MSGAESLNKELIRQVNVRCCSVGTDNPLCFKTTSDIIFHYQVLGTENVIMACAASGVERLVYTSTVNTVFGGRFV